MRLPLKVAILGTNDPRNFSGGRYHGLLLAYAVAAGGGEAHVITDHVPSFVADCEPLAPGKVTFHKTADFVEGLPNDRFDWATIVPTGIFLPGFYENCLDFAVRAQARVALVNFESANWFNALAPEPRDPRLWDYWRRTVSNGGLVLSSARESDRFARAFYRGEPGAHVRFEVWSPPVNAPAALRFDGIAKDGSILAFVRPQDKHKGSGDIVSIDPALFRGRTLRLVAGRDVTPEYRTSIERHLKSAPGSRLELLTRISDLQKFRLMTSAQAVLFPSRFEGFGYPPVEAAYAGTESVCFDLPVLRETVGSIAHFAPMNDMVAFGRGLAAALAEPERREELRAAVFRFADFHRAAGVLADIFLRSADAVRPLGTRPFRVSLGPFQRAQPRAAAEVDRAAQLPPLPPSVRAAHFATSGDIGVSLTFFLAGRPDRVEAHNLGGPALVTTWSTSTVPSDFTKVDAHIVMPAKLVGHRAAVTAFAGRDPIGDPIELQFDRVEAKPADLEVRFGVSGETVDAGVRRIRGWILARLPVTEVRVGNGERWWVAPVTTTRSDILARNPSYPKAPCQFVLELPADAKLDAKSARLIALSDGVVVDTLAGWPPAPASFYPPDVVLGTAPVSPPSPAPVAPPPRPAAKAPAPLPAARRSERTFAGLAAMADGFDIVNLNDTNWTNGISRTGTVDRLGAVVVRPGKDAPAVTPGMILRSASGTARTVSTVSKQGDDLVLVLDGPLDPYIDGYPAKAQLYEAVVVEAGAAPVTFVMTTWSDKNWWQGVWNNRDARWRCGLFLKTEQVRALGIGVGTRLEFAGSGLRKVIAANLDGRDIRLWLDRRIKPVLDGAPHPVRVVNDVSARPEGAISILRREEGNDRASVNLVRLAPDAALTRGAPLRFPSGRIARVVSTAQAEDALEVEVDAPLDPVDDGAPGAAHPLDEVEVAGKLRPPWLYPDAGYKTKDPLHVILARQARQSGRAVLAPSGSPRAERARVLFITLVPPSPANQGNRVVTRNFIQHLVELGFDVDVVLQGWIDAFDATRTFAEHVRILALPFPNWADCDAVRQRRQVKEIADAMRPGALDAAAAAALARESNLFHPYFIVRDEVVEAARTLATTHRYDAIVVNYTHMLRVTEELSRFVDLPAVCVITHDALSRLPTSFEGQAIDTTYRACTPEAERAALDAVPSVVMAISENEARYFKEIGTTNLVVLTEYDAVEETRPYRVPEDGFAARTLVFHGSANPMNIAGLNWFVDECWGDILRAVKTARLVVCGRIGESWKTSLPNIEVMGEMSREAMFDLCRRASVAINPCVAGTGLKIKTVEAACLGLPAVCLPLAVDGLDAVASRFALVADTGESFAEACVTLLTNEPRWRSLRASAITLSEERFDHAAVYDAIDDAMGWRAGVEARLAARGSEFPSVGTLADGPEPTLPEVEDPIVALERNAENPAALLAVGLQLARAGQVDAGRKLVESVVRNSPGDPKVAAMAARLALDTGDPWLAAMHGAVVIAQRPLEAEGYYLVGLGLHGAAQPAAAVECFTQGVLVAPQHEGLLAALDRALTELKRTAEAERWRARRALHCPVGEYIGLDLFRLGPQAIRGWKAGTDGSLELSGPRAAIRFVLPEDRKRELTFTLDFGVERNRHAARVFPVELTANGRPFHVSIDAGGARVQTFRGHIPARALGTDRSLTFTLDFGADPIALPKIKPIGLMLTEG